MKPSQATPPIVEKRSSPNDHSSTAGSQPPTIHQIMLELLTSARYPDAQSNKIAVGLRRFELPTS
jgi:hypothetical protein